MTLDDLRHLCPNADQQWLAAILSAMNGAGITTPTRIGSFLGNVLHETVGLTKFEENLSYSATRLMAVWPSRFTDMAMARAYERRPESIANKVYANRMGNGAETSGDGWRYRGRGPAMLTGRDAYAAFQSATGREAVKDPDSLLTPAIGADSAVWFWKWKGLAALADEDDFDGVVRRWNGGQIGLKDRTEWYDRAVALA